MKGLILKAIVLLLVCLPVRAGLLSNYPWLSEGYGISEDYDDRPILGRKAGAYPVGNGNMFASLGVDDPVNTLMNICGPDYTVPFLGKEVCELSVDGGKETLRKQSIRWVKDADIIACKLSGKNLSLETYDFAPPGTKALIRCFILKNISGRTLNDVSINFRYIEESSRTTTTSSTGGSFRAVQQVKPKKYYTAGTFGAGNPVSFDGKSAGLKLSLGPNEEAEGIRYIIAGYSEEENSKTEAAVKAGGDRMLVLTMDFWRDWMGTTVKISSGDTRLNYILETQKLIIKAQQSSGGGFSPMVSYASTWARDNNGGVLYLLRCGKFSDVKACLDYFYNVTLETGEVPMCVATNCEFSGKKRAGDIDWREIDTDTSETPNWIVKQHFWYYAYTGDLEYIRARLPYLKRCIDGQDVDRKGRLPFEKDETYMQTLQIRTKDFQGYPNYFLGSDAWSADSAFEYVAAAEDLAYLAKEAGREDLEKEFLSKANFVRQATEKYFWQEKEGYYYPALSQYAQPYCMQQANIGLNPVWVGYAKEGDERFRRNFYTTAGKLLKDDWLMKNSPGTEFFTGLVPGMLLYNFAYFRSPSASKAYDSLVKMASPSGDYCEIYSGSGEPWCPPRVGDGCGGRLRPWEGGVNGDALIYYLTGMMPDGQNELCFAPVLPEGMGFFNITGIKVKDKLLDLSVHEEKGEKGKLFYEITNRSQTTADVALTIFSPGAGIVSTTVDGSQSGMDITKIEKKLLPGSALNIEAAYEKKSVKPDVERKKFKHEPLYLQESDIVFVSVEDPYMAYAFGDRFRVEAIDLQMPLKAYDLINAVIDGKTGKNRTKYLVFGPEAFSVGGVNWKTESFWQDSDLAAAFKKFMQNGGVIVVMSDAYRRYSFEIRPKWLKKLLGDASWSVSEKNGRIIASDDFTKTSMKKESVDTLDCLDAEALKSHSGSVGGKPAQITAGIKDQLSVIMKAGKNIQHNLTVRVPLDADPKVLRAELKTDKKFAALKYSGSKKTENALELSFSIPASLVKKESVLLRISSAKKGGALNILSVDLAKITPVGENPLAGMMGFKNNYIVGTCYRSLSWKNMMAPLRLVGDNDHAALLVKNCGKGLFIRTQLTQRAIKPMFEALLDRAQLEKTARYIESQKN